MMILRMMTKNMSLRKARNLICGHQPSKKLQQVLQYLILHTYIFVHSFCGYTILGIFASSWSLDITRIHVVCGISTTITGLPLLT